MSLILDGTNGLTFNNATTQASAGVVLQVVNTTTATQVSTTTMQTYIDTGLSATITPKFSTSKILVLVTQSINLDATSSQNNCGFGVKLLRGSTQIFITVGNYGALYQYLQNYTASNGRQQATLVNINVLDSPATTSATTYKMQSIGSPSTGTLYFQPDSQGNSSITLMEIAG